MRLVIFLHLAFASGCYSEQLPIRTQSVMVPGSPSAEISAVRLKTGDNLKMICRWNGGSPDWEFSSDVRNPSFVDIKSMPEFKNTRTSQCLNIVTCREKTTEASFQPKLAGLYRCKAVLQEPFLVMWVNDTVLINRPLVKKDGYDKPLRLTCSVNLLPADTKYQREVKWYITNYQYGSVDVSKCCATDYLVEPGSSPGPMSLLIHNYDIRRDTGSFQCRVNIDGYSGELAHSTMIYAEAVTSFNITTGGIHSPIRNGQIVEALLGQQLDVTCRVHGYPQPSTIKLVQLGNHQLGVVRTIISGLLATISVSNLTDNFSDSFWCESTQENLPFEQSSITNSQTVKVHVVHQLSPPVSDEDISYVLAGTTQIIIICITIPLVTIVIIVVVVLCWFQRRNRDRTRGSTPVNRADFAARGSGSLLKTQYSKDACGAPLRSLEVNDNL